MTSTDALTQGTRPIDPGAICTLGEDGLAGRLAWIQRELAPHAIRRTRLEDGFAWEFETSPSLVARLDELVALESACCAAMHLSHAPSHTPGRRRLEVHGVDPDAAVLATLFGDPAQREGLPPAPAGTAWARRAARAGLLGTLASLAVCCLLPFGVAALLGAAAAAPLAALDRPWVIAAAALAFGFAAYRWPAPRRRETAAPGAEAGGGCGC